MSAPHSIARSHRWLGAIGMVFTALWLQGCASSTQGGAIGMDRPQLLLVSSDKLNAGAAQQFESLSQTALSLRKLNNDPAMTRRVRGIGRDLIEQVGIYREDAKQWDWEINVFDSDQINAFCAPGGKIGVFKGIIEKLQLTDAELAAVMGHEIAHALREHTREKMSQKTVAGAVGLGLQIGLGVPGEVVNASTDMLVHLPNSRAMELESDVMGLELMARAGYDPRQASKVWTKMQQLKNSGSKSAFFSTHPSHADRVNELNAYVPKVLPLYEQAQLRKQAALAPKGKSNDEVSPLLMGVR